MFGFGDKEKTGIEMRRMSGKERSQFFADLDIAWCFGDNPTGDKRTLLRVSELPPVDAALEVVSHLNDNHEIDLQKRLGNLGVLTGRLRKNKAIPGGVIGIWRADCPVILLTDELPAQYDRAEEIAKALSVLMYLHEKPEAAKEVAALIKPYLTEIEGGDIDGITKELPRRKLGLAAFKKH